MRALKVLAKRHLNWAEKVVRQFLPEVFSNWAARSARHQVILLEAALTTLSGAASSQFILIPQCYLVGSFPRSIVVGDSNGDGKLDVAVADSGSNDVTVLLGDGSGGFTLVPGNPFSVGVQSYSVAVVDFNKGTECVFETL
jgi:hypothetical protein